jgi:glyoxylase-like metal-dependent hydrolase (beta-lactamase superfamily II)
MTLDGTNTYILGTNELAVIDPGPDNRDHLAAILAAVGPAQTITHIIVTHSHLDHSPLATSLAAATGAPILAFGDSTTGRSPAMQELLASGFASGGEGVDAAFQPTQTVADGDLIECDSWSLRVLHTPGHFGNHICLIHGDVVFTGDHVMGWASSLISPPDGDLTDFMTSCARLSTHPARVYYSGHGTPITDPMARLNRLIEHRETRTAQILSALRGTSLTTSQLTRAIYTDIDRRLIAAAERNVLAHWIDFLAKSRITCDGPVRFDAQFSGQ